MAQQGLKNKINTVLPYALLTGIICLIAYFTKGQWDEFAQIKRLNFQTILSVSFLFLLSQVAAGYLLKIFTSCFNVSLKFVEWFGLTCVQSFGNYLPLNAGVASVAAYLKVKKNLPLSQFTSLFAGTYVIIFFSYGLLGIVLLKRSPIAVNLEMSLLFMFIVFALVGLILMLVPKFQLNRGGKFADFVNRAQEGWIELRKKKDLIAASLILNILIIVLIAYQFHLILIYLGYSIGLEAVLLISIVANLLRFSTILPGNLGIREVIVGGLMTAFGLQLTTGLVVAAVTRVIAMFWIFLLGMSFSFILTKKDFVAGASE